LIPRRGAARLLPYTGPQTAKSHNEENPELYAIYPFRLYGLGKPDLELARHSFDIRKCPQKGCWSQDPIQAAMLGYTGVAAEDVRYALTRKDPGLKFPLFGQRAMTICRTRTTAATERTVCSNAAAGDGRKLLLLPAWPADWDADFKLHAPYRTTIEGKVRKGRLTELVVTPASRRADVIDCGKRTFAGTSDLPERSEGYERGGPWRSRPDEVLRDSVEAGHDRNVGRKE
jgi:alpha-L-fucosidase 2